MSHLTQERLDVLRSEYNHRNRLRNGQGKYPRQKMLPEYQFIYPWVIPDELDPYFTFCTVCECRLSAKRSDLGKHEGSIKHTDNVSKKGLVPIAANTDATNSNSLVLRLRHDQQMQMNLGESTAESDEELDFDGDIDIKQEPVVESVGNNSDKLSLKEIRATTLTKYNGRCDNDGDDNDETDGDECDDDEEYALAAKRRTSETDSQSQHSSVTTPLDYLPVQVTVGDASSGQRFSIREISPAGSYRSTAATIGKTGNVIQQYANTQNIPKPTQTPCKITIKKINAPIIPSTPAQVTSTVRITPVSGTIGISQHTVNQLQSSPMTTAATTTVPLVMSTNTTPLVRDSFDLFFDSICASVKALPPKLATEGKIRVMQLIGELELRALTENEHEQAHNKIQQNSAVASTTK